MIEHAPGSNYSGYVPDLPGVGAAADTVEEVQHLLQECVKLYRAGMVRMAI